MATERKKAGRIAPVLMGDYDDTTTYRRLDWVYYGGTSYICKKNNTTGIVPSNTERWQKIIDKISDMSIIFSEVSDRQIYTSGESLSIIIGKIKKYLSDLKKVAFTGKYTDLSDTPISLKNPNALNIKFNGTSQVSYDGSIEKEVNVTPADIGAVNISTLLNTTEQISANTDANNITGALAAKAIMTDYNNKFTQLNSNLDEQLGIFYIDYIESETTVELIKRLVNNKLLPVNKPFALIVWLGGKNFVTGQIYEDYAYGEFIFLSHIYNEGIYLCQIDWSNVRISKIQCEIIDC